MSQSLSPLFSSYTTSKSMSGVSITPQMLFAASGHTSVSTSSTSPHRSSPPDRSPPFAITDSIPTVVESKSSISSTSHDENIRTAFIDLSSRFLLNLPSSETSKWERIFYQMEQAHWYYEDHLRTEDAKLPTLQLKDFCLYFFQYCPLLSPYLSSFEEHFSRFKEYLYSVPVCGGVILNSNLTKCLLVRGYQSKCWGFPKGKINQKESELSCAVRELKEEVGFDASSYINPELFLRGHGKNTKLFLILNVSEEEKFETKTRKEIAEIKWFELEQIFTAGKKSFWPLRPFVSELKKFKETYSAQVTHQVKPKPRSASVSRTSKKKYSKKDSSRVDPAVANSDISSMQTSQVSKSSSKSIRRKSQPKDCPKNHAYYPPHELVFGDDSKGWSFEEMLKANELKFGVRSTPSSDPNDLSESMAQAGTRYKDLNSKLKDSELRSFSLPESSFIPQIFPIHVDNAVMSSTSDSDSGDQGNSPEFQFDVNRVMSALVSRMRA